VETVGGSVVLFAHPRTSKFNDYNGLVRTYAQREKKIKKTKKQKEPPLTLGVPGDTEKKTKKPKKEPF
jgi:hypothetical protein